MSSASRSVRDTVRSRVMDDMLTPIRGQAGQWKLLVLDPDTTKVLSSACRISDLVEYDISVVEDIAKSREPLEMEAVYFIGPTPDSVNRLCKDFAAKPLYPGVHVYFSSPVPAKILDMIRNGPPLLKARLKTMKEVNLEFSAVDSRAFHVNMPQALVSLFGDDIAEQTQRVNHHMTVIARRLLTYFLTTKGYPSSIRYRQSADLPSLPGSDLRQDICKALADKVQKLAATERSKNDAAFEYDCDLIILDRGYDPVAPVVHDWGYEAVLFDLLPLHDSNMYAYTPAGQAKSQDIILDENDPVFKDLRHQHLVDVSQEVNARLQEFKSKNEHITGLRNAGPDSKALKSAFQNLGEYSNIKRMLGIHIDICTQIFDTVDKRDLQKLSELEENLIYGDAKTKDLISYVGLLAAVPDNASKPTTQDRMRLLMCYLATHPEKLDEGSRQNWMKVGRFKEAEMNTITNIGFLGVNVNRKSTGAKFFRRKQRAVRKARGNGPAFNVGRFTPQLIDIVDDAISGRIDAAAFPLLASESGEVASSTATAARPAVKSVRAAQRPTWVDKARKGVDASDITLSGKRVVVFIVGGASRNEMKVVHTLSEEKGVEVVLGTTSFDTPEMFVKNMAQMAKGGSGMVALDIE